MAMALLRLFDNNSIPKPKVLPSDEWKQRLREAIVYTPDAIQLEQSPYQNLFVCDDWMIGRRDHGMLENAERQFTGFTKHNFVFYRRNRTISLGVPLQAWDKGTFSPHPLQGGNRGYAPKYQETAVITQEKKDDKGLVWYSITKGASKVVGPDNPISEETRVPGTTYAPIRGEIYAVPSTLFANSLDKFKMNGTMFVRRRVPIVIRGFQEWNRPSGLIREPFQRIVECWMYVAVPDFWNNLIDAGYSYSMVKHYEADRWDSDYGKFVMRRYYWYNEL